jgi:hypothetical protein
MEFGPEHNGRTVLRGSTIRHEQVKLRGCDDVTITDCNFSFDEAGKAMVTLDNCTRCKILKSEFHDKTTTGNFIKIIGENSKDNLIEDCIFRDHTFSEGNGGEAIRVGESPYSGCIFKTEVRFCRFENLKADDETVSIKSCGNLLEHNEHIDCDSNITIRHGGDNIIRDNKFIGSGGIRVYGKGNSIIHNYHKNNNTNGGEINRRPLIISNGNFENDRNFDSQGRPSKRKGCSHAVYARVKENIIEDNIYDNCKRTCIIWGFKTYKCEPTERDPNKCKKECNGRTYTIGGPKKPNKNKFRKNIIIGDEINGNTTFLMFNAESEKLDNVFEANKLHKAQHGHIPEEPGDTLDERPPFTIPDAGPRA